MPTKVAVIGAGAQGLMAIKNLTEDGFDVTGFESRPYVGGLWKDSTDETLTVHPTTTFNSSKYRAAISDWPFSEDTDDFPTAPQLHAYLKSYSDHFGLTPKIQLNTKVLDLDRAGEKWVLKVQPKDGPARTESFDKVVVSTGSFYKPRRPKLDGVEKFSGDVIHAIEYHGAEPYKNKNVLVMGIHASAQDIVHTLQGTASKVYMAHRTGLVLMPRYTPDGAVFDVSAGLRFFLAQTFLLEWFPRFFTWFLDKVLSSMSRKTFPTKPEWNFLPAPSIAVCPPLVADKLYPLLTSGFATPVSGVKRITGPNSVLLNDDTELQDIDSIIQCTGYDFAIPFISPSSPYQPYPTIGSPPLLYRNIFPLDPDPKVRTSLAFLGQVGVPHPGFVAFELCTQAISQVWQGRVSLPPLPQMVDWQRRNMAWRNRMTRLYGHSTTFYAAFVNFSDHVRWVDRTAGSGIFAHFDWAWFNWRSWRLWWNDRDLYHECTTGVFTPAMFRLFDCGGRKAWAGARDQIFRDNEAVRRQRERKVREMEGEKRKMNGNGEVKKVV